jgi:hypothetical protein
MTGRRGDRGSIMPIIPLVILALLLLGGLVVDAGRALNERSQAQSYAEEAARAGATAVDLSAARLTVEPDEARRRVAAYCADVLANSRDRVTQCEFAGISDVQVTCDGQQVSEHIVVRARVRMQIPTTLLGMIGISSLGATGDAKARPYEGIAAPDSC